MVLPIRPNNNNPIPNSPFYSPETSFIYGTNGWFNLGSTLCVNGSGYINVASGGGGGGVTALAAGPGIALSATTGNITVCTNLVAGSNIALTPTGNQISISAVGVGTGTVTLVAAGNGLSGGPITTSGSLSLNTNCVIQPSAFALKGNLLVGTGAGTYLALNPGTDGQVLVACGASNASGLCWGTVGSVTSVSGIAPISVATGATTPTISIAAASTTASGAVQLNDTLTSTSTALALTAAQGKVLQDQIDTLLVAGTIELAGTIDASTGLVASVTSVGTADGYAVGSALPAASATTNNTYVIVTAPGTMTPPGGSSTAATRGDWFLVSETSPGVFAWTFLNVGFDAPAASTTVPGIVELATNAETATGTDATTAVTPAAAAFAYIPKSALTAKGAIISATAASTPSALGVGTDGQVLAACAAATTGLCWTTPTPTGIPCACITAKGSLVSGTAAATPTALPVGNDGDILVACATATTGLCWTAPTPSGIPCSCILGKGALITGTAGSTPVGLGVGIDNQILVACSTAATGLCWTTPPTVAPAIPCACLTTKGQLITTTTPSTPVALSVGTDGQVLTACSTAATGLCWTVVPVATPTSQGTVLGRVDKGSGGLGFRALNSLTTGDFNVGIGQDAGCSITSGCRNVAVGVLSVATATTASDNVGVGTEALRRTTSGCQNVAIGTTTLVFNTTGIDNVAIGYNASRASTDGSGNIAIGTSALYNNGSGINNISIGKNSGINSLASGSVFVGTAAGCRVTLGGRQVIVGEAAGLHLTTGGCSTAVGWSALPLATGAENIAIGCNAGCNITTGSGNVALGNNSTVGDGALSNQLAIGNSAVTWLRGDGAAALCTFGGFVVKAAPTSGGIAGLTNSDTFFSQDAGFGPILNFGNTFGSGKTYTVFRTNGVQAGNIVANGTTGVLYNTTSDYRLKENVKDLEGATEVLRALPVREYNFIAEPEVTLQGFLAHELQEFVPQAVSGKKDEVDEDGNAKYQGVDLSHLVPLLTAALKESIARIDTLEAKVKKLEADG